MTDWEQIKAEFEVGASKAELSRKYGVSRRQIIRRSITEKWDVTPQRNVTPDVTPDEENVTPEHEAVWERTKKWIEGDWKRRLHRSAGDKDHPLLAKPLEERLTSARRYFENHIRDFGYAPERGGMTGVQG